MVRVLFHGRFGNNLFQYAFGRLLAERLGYALSGEIRDPAATWPLPFPKTHDSVNGHCFLDPIEKVVSQRVDIDLIVARRFGRLIELEGYFQFAQRTT
jgi:hypothetical protein